MTDVIAVIRRDPPRWRRGPCPCGAVSSVRPCVCIVRSFVRSCAVAAAMKTPNQQRQTGVRAVARTLPRVQGVKIVRGCHICADPLGPPLARGRRTGGHDLGPQQVETALAAVKVVRGHIRPASWRTCGLRGPRPPCVPHVSCTTCRSPPRSFVCYVPCIHSAGARSAAQSACTAWHAPRGVVGKLFGGIISYSAHTVRTLSTRSNPQRRVIADLLSIARLPPGHDPGVDYGVATAARQRWHLAIRHFGFFGGPLAAAND